MVSSMGGDDDGACEVCVCAVCLTVRRSTVDCRVYPIIMRRAHHMCMRHGMRLAERGRCR